MEILSSLSEYNANKERMRPVGKTIGFISTEGALNEGHKQLIQLARAEVDVLILSIFANPKEFSLHEKYERYPRKQQQDLEICKELGVDWVFCPDSKELFPDDYSTFINEKQITEVLCGLSRPHYFSGALTLFAKYLNLFQPDVLFFSQKDAQKIAGVRRMIRDLHFDVRIDVSPTVREETGLAVDSRNEWFSTQQAIEAAGVYEALKAGKDMMNVGIRNPDRISAEVIHILSRRIRIIYVSIVDIDSMAPVREVVSGKTLIVAAVWLDEVRMLDNILL
jgi:pantoate--beta-alanine ligase